MTGTGAQQQAQLEDRQRLRAEAAEAAGRMLESARRGLPPSVAVQRHLAHLGDHRSAEAVASELRAALSSAVSTAWPRGWQPADVAHAARRSLSAGEVGAVVQGLREELAGYARSTVDARWWEQLDRLDEPAPAGRRRSSSRDLPGPGTADQEWADLVAATVFVEHLPQLQVLGPLPGEAGHEHAVPEDVDDRLLTKVRRLLAQAEGTPYEAEAETFTAAAQSLMARHRIDRAMLDASDEQTRAARGPGAMRLTVDRPYEQPKMLLLSVIAAANRCRALWNQSVGFATVVGHPADRRAVELLFTSLLVQATTAMQREGERQDAAARTRGFRSSFLSGFAVRIGQRLEEASQSAEEAVRASLEESATAEGARTASPGDQDRMAVALRRRDEQVEQLVRALFPHTVRTRRRAVSDRAGWLQGRAAAERASLGVGGRLTGGAR